MRFFKKLFNRGGNEGAEDPYATSTSDWNKRFEKPAAVAKTEETGEGADDLKKEGFMTGKWGKGLGLLSLAGAISKNPKALSSIPFDKRAFLGYILSNLGGNTIEDVLAGKDADVTDIVADIEGVDKPGSPVDPLSGGMMGYYGNVGRIAGTSEDSAYPSDHEW